MNANKITIEIGYFDECKFVNYQNMSVFKAIKHVESDYKGCYIYSVKTEY